MIPKIKRGQMLGAHTSKGEKDMTATVISRYDLIWVVVKIMVPFWIPSIIRHLIFRVPKKGP